MILLIPVLVGTLAATASAQTTPEADLSGTYICDGMNPNGQPYRGMVEIVKNHDAYHLVWSFDSEVVAIGLGIRSGNVLAVMHYSGLPGVVAYRIEPDDRLVGEWTVPGADGALFSETLTRAPDDLGTPATPGPATSEPPQQQQRRPQLDEVVVAALDVGTPLLTEQ
jgi:hypothetical protein